MWLNSHSNPSALRKAKIVYNFGLSECNRVKQSSIKQSGLFQLLSNHHLNIAEILYKEFKTQFHPSVHHITKILPRHIHLEGQSARLHLYQCKKINQGHTLKVILIFQTLSNDIEKYQDNVDALRNSGGEVERRVSQRDKDLVEDRLK